MTEKETAAPDKSPSPIRQPELPADGCCVVLSAQDYEAVLRSADNPPAPSQAAIDAARRYMERFENG